MTGYGLIASLAWTATAVLFLARADRWVGHWFARTGAQAEPSPKMPPIPDDLMGLVLSEDAGSDELTKQARQSVEDAIRDSYRRYKDWNKVRAAVGIGEMP